MPPLCHCGVKVDRLQDGIQCFLCLGMFHITCCNIKKSDIEFIKNSYKCVKCLSERRSSLSTSPVIGLNAVGKDFVSPVIVVAKDLALNDLSAKVQCVTSQQSVIDDAVIDLDESSNTVVGLSAKLQNKASGDNIDNCNCACAKNSLMINENLKSLLREVSVMRNSQEKSHTVVASLQSENVKLIAQIEGLKTTIRSLKGDIPINSSKNKKAKNNNSAIQAMFCENKPDVEVCSKPVSYAAALGRSDNNDLVSNVNNNTFSKPVSIEKTGEQSGGEILIKNSEVRNIC